MLASPRWKTLARHGACPQRLLWASTGVKDKAYDETRYVVELAAPDTVNTMPAATLQAVADHGKPRGDAIRGTYDEARRVFEGLRAAGVDFGEVVEHLETQGIEAFAKSWDELIASVTKQLKAAGAEVMPAGAVTQPAATLPARMRRPRPQPRASRGTRCRRDRRARTGRASRAGRGDRAGKLAVQATTAAGSGHPVRPIEVRQDGADSSIALTGRKERFVCPCA